MWRSVAYANRDRHVDGGSDSNAYLNANANADSYSYFNIDTCGYSVANAYCEAHCDTTASADAAASSVIP